MKIKSRKYFYLLLTFAFAIFLSITAFSVSVKNASAEEQVEYAVALSEYKIEDYDDSLTVYSPSGQVVIVENEQFLCKELGYYKIVQSGQTIKKILVIYKHFETEFKYEDEILSEATTNENILLPVVQIYSEQETFKEYNIEIRQGNEVIHSFENVQSDITYAFSTSGKYTVVYRVRDSFGFWVEDKHEITVVKAKSIVGVNIPQKCCVLNEIDFSTAEGLFEGNSYPVSVKVYNSQNQEIALNNGKYIPTEIGQYKAVMTCDFEAETVVEEVLFEVVLAEGSLFSNGANITGITLNEDTMQKKGLEISASGASSYVYYNQIIDLSKYSSDDKLISFYVPYHELSDVQDIRVTLIDAQNLDNQISVYWKRSKSAGWEHLTYCLVEFNGYAIAIDNEKGTNLPREVYGALMTCSFLRENYSFNFTYDQNENALYAWRTASTKIKLLDLDDEEALKGYRIWEGFSSNYVYMKIDFLNNVNSTIQVESIDGKNLKAQDNDIVDTDYLRFMYRGNEIVEQAEKMLVGYVNQSYSLPVPITENKLFGQIATEFSLYLDQGAGFNKVDSTINDYTFKPTQKGTYKAVYEYSDLYGNKQAKEFIFEIKDGKAPNISIYGSNITADIKSYCAMPEITITGGTGKVDTEITYTYNGKIVNPNDDGLFFLNEKGQIEIKVVACDEIGVTAIMAYYIFVNNDVGLIEVNDIPLSYIAGREYTLADFTAIDYAFEEGQDGYYMPKSIYVDGVKLDESRTFTCPSGKDSLTITYYGGEGTDREVFKEVIVNIVADGEGNAVVLDNLFCLSENVNGQLFEFGYAVSFNQDISLNYANFLTTRELNLTVSVLQQKTAFTEISFTLQDSRNANQMLEITLKDLTASEATIYVNGKKSGVLKGSQDIYATGVYRGEKYVKFSFYLLDYKKLILNDARNILCEIDSFASGKQYTGFDSQLVSLKLDVKGCTDESTLVVNALSNQSLTSYAIRNGMDKQGPSVMITEEFEKRYQYGAAIAIPNAIAYDVLQGKGYGVYLEVVMPDGTVKSYDAEISNTLLLNQYGAYKFIYSSYDYLGNAGKFEHTFFVKDTEAPKIAVNDQIPNSLSVGDALQLGDFTTSDNIGVTYKCVYIKTPQALLVVVDGSYTFNKEGEYMLIYYAQDANGNDSIVTYILQVG